MYENYFAGRPKSNGSLKLIMVIINCIYQKANCSRKTKVKIMLRTRELNHNLKLNYVLTYHSETVTCSTKYSMPISVG